MVATNKSKIKMRSNIFKKPRKSIYFLAVAGMAVVVLFVMVTDFPIEPDEEIKSRLYGVWRTDASAYFQAHQASFEISREQVVFSTVEGTLDINYITGMSYTPSEQGENLHIEYQNSDGEAFGLNLVLSATPQGDILTFKNQKQIVWKKDPMPMGLR